MVSQKKPATSRQGQAPSDEARGFGCGSDGNLPQILLLECRVERLRSALDSARAEADKAREQLAVSVSREAEYAGRCSELEAELAEARAEILSLHRKLDFGESLRCELEGRLMEPRSDGDAVNLKAELHAATERRRVQERIVVDLRRRFEQVAASRERLFARVAEWQACVRNDSPEAIDLAEFIADLRGEILALEQQHMEAEQRADETSSPSRDDGDEDVGTRKSGVIAGHARPPIDSRNVKAVMPTGKSIANELLRRELLEGSSMMKLRAARRLLDLEGEKASEPIAVALAGVDEEQRAQMLVMIGRTGDARATGVVRPWLRSHDPGVRGSAYEAMCRLLDGCPNELVECVEAGLQDEDPRIRRRVILAVATAREGSHRVLLEPLSEDPDQQVRHLVRRVLGGKPVPGVGEPREEVTSEPARATARAMRQT